MNGLTTSISRSLVGFISRAIDKSPIGEFAGTKVPAAFFSHGSEFENTEQYVEYADFPEIVYENIPTNILVELFFVLPSVINPTGCRGVFVNDYMSLEIWTPKDKKYLNNLLPKIKNVVRHELEHFLQWQRKEKPSMKYERNYDIAENLISYMTSPTEVPAMVVGIKKESDTTGVNFEQVMRQRIEDALSTRFFSPDEEEKVRQSVIPVWISEAKKRGYRLN